LLLQKQDGCAVMRNREHGWLSVTRAHAQQQKQQRYCCVGLQLLLQDRSDSAAGAVHCC
jgi:hypothetical protein